MKLAGLQQYKPPRRRRTIGLLNIPSQHQERGSIEQAQDRSDDELSMVEADERDDGLANAGDEDGTDKRPRHSPRESKMVISLSQALIDVRGRSAVDEDIMSGLDVERLLDFCVRGYQEVDQNQPGYKKGPK